MRAQELIRATNNTKIYLDMDGVLADFFHEYAKLAGVPADKFGRHDYRSIPPAKADPTLDKMVGTDFFLKLPKFPTADVLINLVLQYVPKYGICSSPLRGDNKNSGYWKREWIKKNLHPAPSEIIITGQKESYAVNPDGSPNILIDDRGSNIERWRARGGIGIKYQADEDDLKKVVHGLHLAFGAHMKTKEVVKEAPVDDALASVPGQTNGLDTAKAVAVGATRGLTGLGRAALAGFQSGGYSAGHIGMPTGIGAQEVQKELSRGQQYDQQGGQAQQVSQPQRVMATTQMTPVYNSIKSAVGEQPLNIRTTGNRNLDDLLRKAGVLR